MGELTKRREIRMKRATADKQKHEYEKRIKTNRALLPDRDDSSADEYMSFSNGVHTRKRQ